MSMLRRFWDWLTFQTPAPPTAAEKREAQVQQSVEEQMGIAPSQPELTEDVIAVGDSDGPIVQMPAEELTEQQEDSDATFVGKAALDIAVANVEKMTAVPQSKTPDTHQEVMVKSIKKSLPATKAVAKKKPKSKKQ